MLARLSYLLAKGVTSLPILMPEIDGKSLAELVETFEVEKGYTDPAGGYGGLEFVQASRTPNALTFAGCDDPYREPAAPRILALACECGDQGCWPLTARARIVEQQVVWDEFCQPHRPERDYREFGPFVFEVEQYFQALDLAIDQVSKAVAERGAAR